VAVLVDLMWRPQAGGHVKCWERLAEAAARVGGVDLSVHFQGEDDRVVQRADNVRYVLHRPVFSTSRLPFLSHVPDHTDLASWHPRLARALDEYDVIHTTDAFFAFARTAEAVAARRGVPLVSSVHTDTPRYTRVFMERTLERLLGSGWLTRLLVERVGLPARGERDMLRRLAEHQRRCAFVLVSNADDGRTAGRALPADRVRLMRRGIDSALFTPAKRDRARLEAVYGVPRDAALVLFAGRVNRGKRVMALAHAVRRLRDDGLPVHLLCAGEGEERAAVLALLGDGASCPGAVAQDELAVLYASADLFAFPSEIETFGNVLLEALASGTGLAVAARAVTAQLVVPGETGLLVEGAGTDGAGAGDWAAALGPLLADRPRLAAMGVAAARYAAQAVPSWDEVFSRDVLALWRTAAGR
jgi:glycosyltransferase involved in cell wall biosynthesis